MNRIVYLARHASHAEVGATLSGRSAIGLSARGRHEAEALATRLASVPLVAIHSSPRQRTQETAAVVARLHGLPVRIAPALDEIDFGAFTGRSFAALDGDPAWHRWNGERATARCPGGETMAEAVARVEDWLPTLGTETGPVLCVSHCDLIRGVIATRLGLGPGGIFALECDPASLSALAMDGGGTRLVLLNERPATDYPAAAARSRSIAAITLDQSPVLA